MKDVNHIHTHNPVTEAELCLKFQAHFTTQGYEVYKEVPIHGFGGRIVDMVATIGTLRIAIEVKRHFNWDVMQQAFSCKPFFHMVYVAAPTEPHSFAYQVCKDYGIGALVLNKYTGLAEQAVAPKLFRTPQEVVLQEYMKLSTAGTQTERITPFKNSVHQICKKLKNAYQRKMKIADVMKDLEHHWKGDKAARVAINVWVKKGLITEFDIVDGCYVLNEAGIKHLQDHDAKYYGIYDTPRTFR